MDEIETKSETEIKSKNITDINGLVPKGMINVDTNKPPLCSGLCLNIGSGKDYKQGYINIDKYDTTSDADWDIEHLPLRENSVAQIVCGDVLEHLPHSKILPVFKEWHRVLKKEGRAIIVVPDLVGLCNTVLENPEDDWKLAQLYGHQQHPGQFHKTGFTVRRLSNLLGFAGFNSLTLAYYTGGDGLKSIYCEAYIK